MFTASRGKDSISTRQSTSGMWDISRRQAVRFVTFSLGAVVLVHFLGRFGYYQGWYSFVVADTVTLFALFIMSMSAALLVQHVCHVKTISRLLIVSAILIALGQAINIVDGIPAFGGMAPVLTRPFIYLKEPISALGITAFIGSLYFCIFELGRAKQETEQERRNLAVMATERQRALESLGQLHDQMEQRVVQRTAELAEANIRLQAEIAERQQAERALKRSESLYRELVQNANSIIMRMDTHGTITFFNEYAQQFFGYSESEILGQNVADTIVPGAGVDGQDLASMIRDIARNPERYINHENENIRRNGERVWIAWTNRPIFDAAGDLVESLCVGNDITARIRAERTVAEQRIKMISAARMSELGLMAGGIAHEINNPLAVIAMGAQQLETLLGKPDLNHAQIIRITEAIGRNVSRVQSIIRALRSLAREGSNDPFLPVAVQSLVADVLELCQERLKIRNISLKVLPIPEEAVIECRPSQISQVLLNLINNAYDAVEKLSEKWIELCVDVKDHAVLISIADSGPGLSADMLDKIFVPFFTTKKEGVGIGLGLSLSKAIVESHQGELTVDTDAPNTRFQIRLPKYQSDPAESIQ